MFVPVFFAFLLCQTSADPQRVKYTCSVSTNNTNNDTMTFNPASDGVEGRYTAELCTLDNPNRTDWTIDLTYYDNPKYCVGSRWLWRPGQQHSTNTLEIQNTLNCTHVCYAMNFDLIFSSCYGVKSTFKEKDSIIKNKKISKPPHDSRFIISNNLTKANFSQIMPHVNFVNHEEEVTLSWYLGISPTEFRVEMYLKDNKTLESKIEDVTQNCSVQGVKEVQCVLAPPYGCYHALLVHEAPWTSGIFNNKTFVSFDFCHKEADAPSLSAGSARVLWACGGVLLGTCALLAAAALRSALRTRSYHKHVLESWRRNRGPGAAPAARGARAVLLLYAREAAAGQRAAASLKALVQDATGGQVYDLYSPEVTALCAAAPGAWLRGVLASDDVRVLLLQSPAVAALFQATLCEHGAALKLQEPLLGRRAMYRAPQFGDQLLQMALRLIAETAATHHAYHKYYLATYSELETEVLQQVVPYRRYVLPGAAGVLCGDLAGAPPPAPLLLQHARAVLALQQHARAHPDYLLDELIIM